jgi:hypothetical protein
MIRHLVARARGNGVTTHLPSEAMAEASLQERRARLRAWIRFADDAQIVGGVNEGTRLCTVCNRMIGKGELDFLVVLAGAVALRVDRECLDLWHEAVTDARHRASFPPDLRPVVGTCAGL